MKMKYKKFLIINILLFAGLNLFAQKVQVSEVNGKVQIFSGGTWKNAKVGDVITEDLPVSTGFNSSAKIRCGESVFALGDLTNLSFTEISYNILKVQVNNGVVRAKTVSKEEDADKMQIKLTSALSVSESTNGDFLITSTGLIKVFEGSALVYSPKIEGTVIDYRHDPDYEEYSQEELEKLIENERIGKKLTGSVVVKKNQFTTIDETGIPEKPMDTSRRKVNLAKGILKTAGEKEAVSTGVVTNNIYDDNTATADELKKGSATIEITLPGSK